MNTQADGGYNGFLIGLITGGAIGAGLALAFAPRLRSELRERVTSSANDLSHAASQRYQEVSTRVAGVVDDVTAKGQAVRDDVADAVGRGAREVEQRIAGVVDGVTAKGQAVRDDVADAVGRAARDVEQFAAASKTVPGPRRS